MTHKPPTPHATQYCPGGWIASGHPAVSQAAADMLEVGGNAFDAAVAAGFSSSIAEPALTSLGGGGFLLARTAEGRGHTYDFFVNNPGQDAPKGTGFSRFTPVTISFDGADQTFNIGKGSAGTPGVLKGLLKVHERHGRLPLEEVVAPAIDLAQNGVLLTGIQAYTLFLLGPILTSTEEGRALYAPGGQLLQKGERFSNKKLATFLRGLPASATSFYEGTLAKQMATEISLDGGLLTRKDLQDYEVVERHPLQLRYRGNQVWTNPPPSFGGQLVGLSLALLEKHPVGTDGFLSPSHVQLLAKILVETEEKREAGILYSDQLNGAAEQNPFAKQFSRGTTHVTVADGDGNIACMSTSNGEGSGHFAPETGIMLNNMLGEDDLHPKGYHHSPPGTRVASMMSPCLVLDENGKPVLALGSGGSKRIRSAVFQVLTHVLDYGVPLKDAVLAPRVHWEGGPLQVEGGHPADVMATLASTLETNEWPGKNLYFGGVHAVIPNRCAFGDPRRGGSERIVPSGIRNQNRKS